MLDHSTATSLSHLIIITYLLAHTSGPDTAAPECTWLEFEPASCINHTLYVRAMSSRQALN